MKWIRQDAGGGGGATRIAAARRGAARVPVTGLAAFLFIVAAVLPAVGCADRSAARAKPTGAGPARYPYVVICTTGMVADIVTNVAGQHAEVTALIGSGVDPHLYQATRNDVARLLDSDVVFYNGLLLEGKLVDALVRVGRQRPVFAVTELIDASKLIAPEHTAGHADPHVWMDVGMWTQAAGLVAEALIGFDPAHAADYRSNLAVYSASLAEMDSYARARLATIPAPRRVLVTAHDAFNYMARAYAFEVRGVQGISTESEAGIADINALVKLLVARRIRAVFVESSVSDKNIQALVEGARSNGHVVTIGGRLFSDAMGPAGTYEGTYVGMIDHNVTAITRALGGDAPAGGLYGRLTPGGGQ